MLIRRHFSCCGMTVSVDVPRALQNHSWFVQEQVVALDHLQNQHDCRQALDELDPATSMTQLEAAGDTVVSPSGSA